MRSMQQTCVLLLQAGCTKWMHDKLARWGTMQCCIASVKYVLPYNTSTIHIA